MHTIVKLFKKYTFISSFILIFLINVLTDFPLQDYLSHFISYQASLMISILVKQMSCFLLLLYLSYKLKISDDFNLTLKKPIKNLILIIPFLLLILINISDKNINELIKDKVIFILYFFAFLSTGFIEEILFRGIVFNLINNKYGTSKKMFYFSVIISGIIFGGSHIINLLNGTMPLLNFLNQLLYASIIGIAFTAIYLRCNSLLIPIILHGLIDVTGCTEFLRITSKELEFQSRLEQAISFNSIITSLILFTPLLIWSLFILRKVKITINSNSSVALE